jgi:hypothetical protein
MKYVNLILNVLIRKRSRKQLYCGFKDADFIEAVRDRRAVIRNQPNAWANPMDDRMKDVKMSINKHRQYFPR